MSPIFKDERIYKNYKIFKQKKVNSAKIFKKFDIVEVDLLDNNLFINKKMTLGKLEGLILLGLYVIFIGRLF